jgi:hypothetical protein
MIAANDNPEHRFLAALNDVRIARQSVIEAQQEAERYAKWGCCDGSGVFCQVDYPGQPCPGCINCKDDSEYEAAQRKVSDAREACCKAKEYLEQCWSEYARNVPMMRKILGYIRKVFAEYF